jgi:NADP-dependent 3-hydroxy acid dehydrogenase YdfG
MKSLFGKGVVITGAASGIGAALARALAQRGAKLLLADVDAPRLQAVLADLRAQGAACEMQVVDVAKVEHWRQLAERAQQLWGGADVLVNNAGVALVAPAQTVDEADARWLMEINFWGVWHGCRAFVPQLHTRPHSVIVNLSSIFAMISMPTQSIYNASKAAVRGFSDALREELADSPVAVLCVHPGGIATDIARHSRRGDISMIAANPQALEEQFDRAARTSAADAAAAIVGAIEKGRTRLLIGADARLADWIYRLLPARASRWFSAGARWERRRYEAQKVAGGGAAKLDGS